MKKRKGDFCLQVYFVITVLVMVTIFVTFDRSKSTITNALPVVSFCNINSALVAFVTTLPLASIMLLMIGLTEVTLYPLFSKF
jgi:hypothetical protein